MFTLIGGGMKNLGNSYRLMKDVLPSNAKWIKEKAVEFSPKTNSVTTSGGVKINYDIMLVGTGLQLNYDKVILYIHAYFNVLYIIFYSCFIKMFTLDTRTS